MELEGDASDGAFLDALDEVGGESGDLVAEALGGDGGDLAEDLLVGVEVERHARVVLLHHLPGGFLHCLRSDSAHCGGGGGGGRDGETLTLVWCGVCDAP